MGHSGRWPLIAIGLGSLLSLTLIAGITSAASTVTVTINDTSLSPASVATPLGNSIDWQNATSVAQVVTIGSTILPTIQPGTTSAPWKPSATGTYSYTVRRTVAPKTALHGAIDVGPGPTPTRSPSPSTRPSPTPTTAARTTTPSEPAETGIIVELTAPPSASDFSPSPEPSESTTFAAPIVAGSIGPVSAQGSTAPAASGGIAGVLGPLLLVALALVAGVYAYRRSMASQNGRARLTGQAHPITPPWSSAASNSAGPAAPPSARFAPPGWVPVDSAPPEDASLDSAPTIPWTPSSDPRDFDHGEDEDAEPR